MWFSKKKKEEVKVNDGPFFLCKKDFEFVDEEFDVGQTVIELTFDDKSKFKTTVYGKVEKTYCGTYYGTLSSIKIAEDFISELPLENCTYVNDALHPIYSKKGIVKEARILETKSFLITERVKKEKLVVCKSED